ncbi:hypothetical protein [Planctopirus hydrillae]|uniref:Uncharacterized protein n=1 Tax=Planctopirus hydrillae TaxID=1841610 RepID=A0A1C3EQE9_9PLAN|nr:hypothetical protein [Planctopirus hydrillae]ODA35471.1 hypothetical protein A6X21_16795 [Planctopirus hydrillae]
MSDDGANDDASRPLSDAEAFELIDAHLDRHPLTDEQSDALTAWIKADPEHADRAFYRIFLHSYLRTRLQAGLPATSDLSIVPHKARYQEPTVNSVHVTVNSGIGREDLDLTFAGEPEFDDRSRSVIRRWSYQLWVIPVLLLLAGCISLMVVFSYWSPVDSGQIYAEESFDYERTPWSRGTNGSIDWPTSGGMNGLNGGSGWLEPWKENDSKVAMIADYSDADFPWEPKDMRKFGPLGYTDASGLVLKSTGKQMRTATRPRSVTTRKIDIEKFPTEMRDGDSIGADGTVIWISFLAQSSISTAENNRYSYLLLGSKEVAGLRIGKLGAAPSGNWTAVALQTEAEVNLKTSSVPSGEMVFLVTRIIFRPGTEEAVVWINPQLGEEPQVTDAALRLQIPDFRFDGISIRANHSTDFDEIRVGSSFRAVAPVVSGIKALP